MVGKFISMLPLRISYSADGANDWSVALGISPRTHQPEEVYQLPENNSLYTAQTEHLTTYQINFLRAIYSGEHKDFSSAKTRDSFNLGSYSNIVRLKKALENIELIDISAKGIYFSDPVLEIWFGRNFQ